MKIYFVILSLVTVKCLAINLMNVVDCGKTKGCFLNPANCDPSKNCNVAVSYAVDNDEITFEFTAPARIQIHSSEGQYIALGFSDDRAMGDDAVTECIFSKEDPSKTIAGVSYNKKGEKQNVPITDVPTNGIVTLVESGLVGKTFICRLKQKIQPNFNDNRVRPLNKPYYLLMVTGTANLTNRSLTLHNTDDSSRWFPGISKDKVDLTTKLLSVPGPHSHDHDHDD